MGAEILNKFLTEMGEMLKEAKDFSMEQLPLVAKEILAYNLAVSVMWATFGAIIILSSMWLFRKVTQIVKEERDAQPLYMVPFFTTVIGLIIFLANFSECLKIYLAPRLFLLEYIAQLLHHVSGK